jgi:hypothetical protein
MPTLLSRLRDIVWTAVFSIASGSVALVAALLSADLELVLGFGVLGLILAILSPRPSL